MYLRGLFQHPGAGPQHVVRLALGQARALRGHGLLVSSNDVAAEAWPIDGEFAVGPGAPLGVANRGKLSLHASAVLGRAEFEGLAGRAVGMEYRITLPHLRLGLAHRVANALAAFAFDVVGWSPALRLDALACGRESCSGIDSHGWQVFEAEGARVVFTRRRIGCIHCVVSFC